MKTNNCPEPTGDPPLKKPQRTRTKYTREQLEALEKQFSANQYPDTLAQEDLALELGVTLEKVAIWFQNRRSKFKRQSRSCHLAWMRKQIYPTGAPEKQFPIGPSEEPCFPFISPQLPPLPERCHVLSPPDTNQTARQDIGWDKPSSSSWYPSQACEDHQQVLDLSQVSTELGSTTRNFSPGFTPPTSSHTGDYCSPASSHYVTPGNQWYQHMVNRQLFPSPSFQGNQSGGQFMYGLQSQYPVFPAIPVAQSGQKVRQASYQDSGHPGGLWSGPSSNQWQQGHMHLPVKTDWLAS